ncbi:type VI secretion system baseplate subunit TssF [Piscinibacter sp. HJYY11]|uniref:type VI secretion system baseplate subunit TssF n=1 Tax=Piscinibacter sp. HJYY11 TaxID=2801333 RepID=UPI00191D0EFE|nr:type VI secretion system baseplate subunit TssF [Piscinibacter sp. HJYY11]MBL0726390.1 type VI secretion system baseplate subunit TssF [Piscinibacter sp. HJYY11]
MDPNLLRHYNDELTHLREVGAEFAQEFPKIAARLSLDGLEVTDPYVERLLEGFAFLAARIQLKLDAEHPKLIQHLLETVYPGFLSPVPSMVVARMRPDPLDPNLTKGFTLKRGSALTAEMTRGQNTRCEFRTAHDVTLWPIEITSVQYFTHAPDLPLAHLPVARQVKGGLRIKLKLHGGLSFRQLKLDHLPLFISAPDEVAFRLHELVLGNTVATWVAGANDRKRPMQGFADAESLQPLGFSDDEALLPETLRGFSGHRLLQELAAMPQRFLFFDVQDLARRLDPVEGAEAEIVLLFSRGDAALESLVDAGSLALFCTPAVNLFSKRLDRIQMAASGTGSWEHHVVPDRTRPMDYEVHTLESVTGYGTAQVAEQKFLPLYASYHDESRNHGAYFTVRREPRLLSSRQRQDGPRSAYVGQEVFVSLVDPQAAPYREDIRQLSLTALVTNRDLPTLLPGNATTWTLDAAGPAGRIETLRGPTRPVQRLARGDVGWSLVSLLTLNYLSIAGDDPKRAAATLRNLLALHGPEQDVAWAKQVESLQWVEAKSVVRRLPFPGPLTFGCGVEVTALVDELGFQGSSAFLLGQVLSQFFARHASTNSFCETVLRSATRGEIFRAKPRIGEKAVL